MAELTMDFSDLPWKYEMAFYTLKALLPNSYPKETHEEILTSTINYLRELKAELLKNNIKYPNYQVKLENSLPEAPEPIPTFSRDEPDHDRLMEDILDDLDSLDNEFKQGGYKLDFECMTVDDVGLLVEQSFRTDTKDLVPTTSAGPVAKRPGNGFIRFSIAKRKEVSMMNPSFDNREISRILGCMWRKLSDDLKQVYIDDFNKDMKDIREKYPDWNYAASRAKTARKPVDTNVILPERLRSRTVKRNLFDFESPVKNEIGSKPKKKKQNEKKPKEKKPKRKKSKKSVTDLWVQCALCGQWRKLFQNVSSEELPDVWNCTMNPDPLYQDCTIKQESE